MRTLRTALCLLVVCAFLKSPLSAQEKIVAIVNNEVITKGDLEGFANFMRVQLSQQYGPQEVEEKIGSMKKDLLQRLIEDRLILQEAKKKSITVDDARVSSKIAEIRGKYNSEREFANALMEEGLSVADLEKRIRDQLLMYRIVEQEVRSKVLVSPTEITQYYDLNFEQFDSPEERQFVSLVVDSEATAKAMAEDLAASNSIEDTAQKYSIKPNDLDARRGELKKELEEKLFSMSVNDIAGPFKINEGYYVFKLIKIEPAKHRTLVEVQDDISKLIFEKKLQESMVKWVDKLKQASFVKLIEES